MTEAISEKDTYRVFVETMKALGYQFNTVLDERKKLMNLEWTDPAIPFAGAPRAWCIFTFIRRQSWLQVSLYFNVSNAPDLAGYETRLRDIMSFCSSYPDFKEDYPKSEIGAVAAAQECAKWIARFQREVDGLSQIRHWTGDMILLEKPIKNWLVMPGWGLWED